MKSLTAHVLLVSCSLFDLPGIGGASWTQQADSPQSLKYQTREFFGWTIHIRSELLDHETAATGKALVLLRNHLNEIVRTIPKPALIEMRKVPLWVSPEYPGVVPRAEYHPGAEWLERHGRNPAMAHGVEITNFRIFEAETRRMPCFILHELAHAYHDRVLFGGFDNAEVKARYEVVMASGKYQSVERQDSEGHKSIDRAYALTNSQEFFAESTEAYFGHNDFFPYTNEQLKSYDLDTWTLIGKLWGVRIK